MFRVSGSWQNRNGLAPRDYVCGFCGKDVASITGYYAKTSGNTDTAHSYVCPRCNLPTLFYGNQQIPGELPGRQIDNLPEDISKLYKEAQQCISVNSFTACVLTCRKMLMHIGHDKGATGKLNFVEYIEHLNNEHYIPPNGKGWVDYIRKKGNQANHEIVISEKEDAIALLALTEMLLLNIYDLPFRVPGAQKP